MQEMLEKGGVIQLGGWLGTFKLYPGAILDSKYLNDTGILENQKKIQEGMGGVQIINVLDRGYRSTKAAWRNGQFILQPTFARSDKKFLAKGTLQSALIASYRSGNERAIEICKSSSCLKNGIKAYKQEFDGTANLANLKQQLKEKINAQTTTPAVKLKLSGTAQLDLFF